MVVNGLVFLLSLQTVERIKKAGHTTLPFLFSWQFET